MKVKDLYLDMQVTLRNGDKAVVVQISQQNKEHFCVGYSHDSVWRWCTHKGYNNFDTTPSPFDVMELIDDGKSPRYLFSEALEIYLTCRHRVFTTTEPVGSASHILAVKECQEAADRLDRMIPQ